MHKCLLSELVNVQKGKVPPLQRELWENKTEATSNQEGPKTISKEPEPRSQCRRWGKRWTLNWAMGWTRGNHGGSLEAAKEVSKMRWANNSQRTQGEGLRINLWWGLSQEGTGFLFFVLFQRSYLIPRLTGPEESCLVQVDAAFSQPQWGVIITLQRRWGEQAECIREGSRRAFKRREWAAGTQWERGDREPPRTQSLTGLVSEQILRCKGLFFLVGEVIWL